METRPTAAETGGSPALVELADLEKSYASAAGRAFVLRRITTTIRAGEFVTIMGPSGAGKSTLLGVLGMLDADFEGEYRFSGQSVRALRGRDRAALNRRHISIVFQSYHLLDELTVYENLEVPLSYRNIPKDRRQAIVADTLDRFGIVAKTDLYPNQLSGGQQQTVAIARAVIAEPTLLLADEPTGNLHLQQGREVMAMFRRLHASGTTIVQVTHSEENARYGTRILRLRDGWLDDDEQLAEADRNPPAP